MAHITTISYAANFELFLRILAKLRDCAYWTMKIAQDRYNKYFNEVFFATPTFQPCWLVFFDRLTRQPASATRLANELWFKHLSKPLVHYSTFSATLDTLSIDGNESKSTTSIDLITLDPQKLHIKDIFNELGTREQVHHPSTPPSTRYSGPTNIIYLGDEIFRYVVAKNNILYVFPRYGYHSSDDTIEKYNNIP